MTDDEEIANFARTVPGPLGKLTAEQKTKIDPVTVELWLKHCKKIRSNPATQIRNFIYMTVYGKTHSQLALEKTEHDAQSIEALTKLIGSFEAPESGGEDA